MTGVWTDPVDRATNDVVTAAQWNELLGDTGNLQFLYERAPTTNYKTSTQVFTTTTTFTDVSGADAATFSFAIAANEVWEVEYYLPFVSAGTGGVKFQLTGPAAPTGVEITGTATLQLSDNVGNETPTQTPFAPVQAFSTAFAAASAAALGTGGEPYVTGRQSLVWARARIINGANAGTVTLQAAQTSSNSTTTLGLGTFMRAEKIS